MHRLPKYNALLIYIRQTLFIHLYKFICAIVIQVFNGAGRKKVMIGLRTPVIFISHMIDDLTYHSCLVT